MAGRLKYNQTQFLECIKNVEENDFSESHKSVLQLLMDLAEGNATYTDETILQLDMGLIEELDEYIDSALKDNGMTPDNPVREIIRGSELRVSLDIVKVRDMCVQDRDFF